ncbi:hypothetical protein GCM10011571_32690 [Marinithermofilum abyssi]|uniref:Transglycosylase SLT domain-containing protein n=1 Tax=Marinithermofilum abyssi TaxID=1571185 RepID=A0A8J2VLC7_9BACL|nr:peptidoglycan DD-metalloendopeptidase family protein [Marinithermofilum abyssi]GGE28032.1 hypothetical protein GCM10011571_32690 [Marinithermofilum abyssi]
MNILNSAINQAASLGEKVYKAKAAYYMLILLAAFLLVLLLGTFLITGMLMLFGGESQTKMPESAGEIDSVKYAEHINAAAAKYKVDPALIAAIIKQESNFNPRAGSHANARGLMQLMPFNLKGIDPYDPKQNILRGTEIIAGHLRHYKGNLNLALAAYNAGSGAVAKDLARGGDGIPDNGETPEYVQKVKQYYEEYKVQVVNGQITNGTAPAGGGKLGLPAKTKISCGFTCYKNHGGIDFSSKGNRAIFAAADGRVIKKENLNGRSYGTLVVIDHGGIQTAYAHMFWDDIQVDAGDTVKKGQRIGTMGDNGKAKGVHLHFEVRKDGERIDPLPYLTK